MNVGGLHRKEDGGETFTSDPGFIRELMTELLRRVASPDPRIASMRTVNSHLQQKINKLEKEVQDLKRDIKLLVRPGKEEQYAPFTVALNLDQNVFGDVSGNIDRMSLGEKLDWNVAEDSDVRKKGEDPTLAQAMTRRIVSAVDSTLKIFLERILPLEGAVAQLKGGDLGGLMHPANDMAEPMDLEEGDTRERKRRAMDPPTTGDKANRPKQIGLRSLSLPSPLLSRGERNGYMDVGSYASLESMGGAVRSEKMASIILQVEEKPDVDYNLVMKTFRESVDPEEEFQIKEVQVRRTASGKRIFTIRDHEASSKANLLLKKLNSVATRFGEHVSLYRPKRRFSFFRASGFDETITKEEIESALVKIVGCTSESLKIDTFNSFNDRWVANIRCNDESVYRLHEINNFKVGWTRASIRYRKKAMRCFRCLRTGHVSGACGDDVDRSGTCFNCGAREEGHSSNLCDRAPSCILCKDLNRDFDHRLGNYLCICPSFVENRQNRYLSLG